MGWKFIECAKINAHFYRDFITVSDDEMLDALDDTKYEVIGFQRDHTNASFTSGLDYQWGTTIAGFQPVVNVFREKIEAAREDIDAEEKKDDEKKEVEAEADGAAQFGAYAAVIFAGLATLCF